MSIFYYECSKCETVYIFGEDVSSKNLICGSACGGVIEKIDEKRAREVVDKLREE